MPGMLTHMRIFRYNRALAHLKLGDNASAVAAASELIEEYLDGELGITAGDVIGRNANGELLLAVRYLKVGISPIC